MRPFPLPLSVAVAVAIGSVAHADTGAVTVRVVVTNVVRPGGVLIAGAYDTADTWLGATTVARKDVPVSGNVSNGAVTFEMQLPPGRYALSVFQDMNGNRKLDTNFLGIPTEASGSSNDPPAKWSAPKFKDAVVNVGDTPVELTITLR